MKLIAALLVGIIIALIINAAMLARIERALPRSADVTVPIAPQASTTAPPAKAVLSEDASKQDSAAILAALAVVRRHQEQDGTDAQLVRFLRDIDSDAYFADLKANASAGSMRRAINSFSYGESEVSDARYVPILTVLGRRALLKGNVSEAMQLAGFASRFDDPSLRPIIVGATERWLEQGSGGRHLDARTVRTLLCSGLPAAHAEVFRWLVSSDHGDDERHRVYRQLRDLYDPVRKLPPVSIGRENNEKLSAADKGALRETEEWIRENRILLVYDPSLKVMLLAKDAAEAIQLRAKHEPTSTAIPDSTPAPTSPKSDF